MTDQDAVLTSVICDLIIDIVNEGQH
jgi:hypothetical protein